MDNAHFLSGRFEVIEALKPTQAKMLKNIEVGDILIFEVELKPAGSNRGTYATYITIINNRTGEETDKSFNQLDILYRAFKLQPLD